MDEAATISAASRPWTDLWRLLGNIDAVHGAYYAVMHLWFDVFGVSAVSLRALSAVSVGCAAAGVVVLGRMLGGAHSARLGVCAGLVFAVLPRVTWMATEGRSFALVTAVAVWLTVVLVAAARRGGAGLWVAYAVGAGLGVALWAFLGLLLVAHGVTLLWWRVDRRRLLAFGAAAGVGGLLAAPILFKARGQSGPVAWIPEISPRTVRLVAVDQWFGTDGYLSLPVALVCWIAVALVVLRVLRPRADRSTQEVVRLALPWLVLPTAGVLAASLLGPSMYTPKYLSFSLPAMALLVGLAVATLPTRAARVAVLVVIAVAAVPSYVAERRLQGKDASDWALAAERVEAAAEPGDAVVFTDFYDEDGNVRYSGRALKTAYPRSFEGLTDPTLRATSGPEGTLGDETADLDDVRDELLDVGRIVLVADPTVSAAGDVRTALDELGFRVDQEWSGDRTDVLLLVRTG